MLNKRQKQYWAYARVSTYTQKKHNTIKEQTRPLKKWLKNHYSSKNQIRKHLYHETYTGTTMARPKFKSMLKKVKPGDTICFKRMDRMSRSLDGADKFIRYCRDNNITIHILVGDINLNPNSSIGLLEIHMFMSFAQFEHDLIVDRMADGKRKAKEAGKPNWNGGIAPRFYGKKKQHYIAIYEYTKDHSIHQTSLAFDIGTATVSRIKRDGKEYFANKEAKQQNPNQTELIK